MKHATMRVGVLLALAACLIGCSGEPTEVERDIEDTEALPQPENAGASVTGMPANPGPGQIGSPAQLNQTPTAATIDNDGNIVDGDGLPSLDALTGDSPDQSPVPTSPADGPGADEAVAVIRDYYDAINAGAHDQAYGLWSDHGKASGQSPVQFADGFDGTVRVSVEVMAPGRIDLTAGSRYIEVPIALSATHRDGSTQKYVGAYTLRRTVVDGASAEQRAWRITSADIREVRP